MKYQLRKFLALPDGEHEAREILVGGPELVDKFSSMELWDSEDNPNNDPDWEAAKEIDEDLHFNLGDQENWVKPMEELKALFMDEIGTELIQDLGFEMVQIGEKDPTPKFLNLNVWGDTPKDMAQALEELAKAIRQGEEELFGYETTQLKVTDYGDCN